MVSLAWPYNRVKFICSLFIFLSILCLIWRTLAILSKLLGSNFPNHKMELIIIIANCMSSGKIGHYQNNYKMFYIKL